jgi:PAS domain S-box-containing protein
MLEKQPALVNIALVGGDICARDVLERTTLDFLDKGVNARFTAIADPDPESPGMVLARQLNLTVLTDYHDLYDPEYAIDLIIIIHPDEAVFDDILRTRPPHIRLMSHRVFMIFWKAIRSEERKLREQYLEMKTILDGIQDFILVITPEMEILEANGAFLEKMGYTREEVIGRRCHEVYNRLDEPCNTGGEVCPLREVIKNQRSVRQISTRGSPKGKLRHFEADIFPIWEKDGKISKFIHISRDITERKEEEERITRRLEQMVEERTRQLKETHQQLLHQDKMASLGKLAASVVHEINNPIAGILNLLLLIRRINDEGETTAADRELFGQYLTLAETETRRISRIVSNLLAFSRQSKMELKQVDLNRLIETTLFLNANMLKIKGVKVRRELDGDLPPLLGSEDQLEQVFMNLISNAAEAIEGAGGGELIIASGHRLAKNTLRLTFADTGVGVPEENVQRLFEPFFTTKKKGKGVGLGLSVAYGIVQEHGGTIEVTSEVGKGTTFTIDLPLEKET